jgi:hypothetical protein
MSILGASAPLTKADTLNAILESAEEYRLQRRLGNQAGRRNVPLPPDLVKIKNETSTALRAGEIVGLDGSPISPLVRGFPWFTGKVPTDAKPLAVMLEDVPNDSNAFGLAQISGVCPALVNLNEATDRWAHMLDGQDVLKGDYFWGDVRILWSPGGTGEKLCWVSFEKSPDSWLGKLETQPIDKGQTATVKVFEGAQAEIDTGKTIANCFNKSIKLTSTTKLVAVNRIHRKPFVSPWEC